jgi:hypothetical protein
LHGDDLDRPAAPHLSGRGRERGVLSGDDDVVAVVGEQTGELEADAARGTGDERERRDVVGVVMAARYPVVGRPHVVGRRDGTGRAGFPTADHAVRLRRDRLWRNSGPGVAQPITTAAC